MLLLRRQSTRLVQRRRRGNGECQNVVNNTGYCNNGPIINNDIADTSVR
ncbi:MAG: hypothetical protein IPG63_17655 [Xanthomonadales bacterium]|nr:hypothetical protein [Xanthomonadales bacterium]